MDLNKLRDERKKWLTWKNITPYQEAIKALKSYEDVEVKFGDRVEVQIPDLSNKDTQQILFGQKLMILLSIFPYIFA